MKKKTHLKYQLIIEKYIFVYACVEGGGPSKDGNYGMKDKSIQGMEAKKDMEEARGGRVHEGWPE